MKRPTSSLRSRLRLVGLRLGSAAVAAACGLATWLAGPAAYGAEEYERFLNALRQRKYFDTALEYLDTMRSSPLLTEEQRQMVTFEEARTYLEASRDVDFASRDKMLDGARDRFEKFVNDTPDHPQAAGAATQLGAVLVERGRSRVEQALLPSTPDDVKKKLMTEARPHFDEAEKVFIQAEEKFQKIYDSFPRFMTPDDPRSIQRENAKGEMIKAHMYHAYGLYQKSRTFAKDSAEWKKALLTAAEKYGSIYKDYRTLVAGLSARLQEGKCYQELGDTKRALGLFNDLIGQPDDIKELRPYKASAMYLSLQCWISDTEKMYELGSLQADEFINAAANEDEGKPEWLAVRYFGAVAHKLFAEQIPADAKGEDVKKRDANLEKARQYAEYVARVNNDYQAQARDLLRELSGGIDTNAPARSFLDAQTRGQEAMTAFATAMADAEKLPDAEKPAKLKEADDARTKALEFFNEALRLADDGVSLDEKNVVRYHKCYLTYTQGKMYDAAVIGEFLLNHYPNGKSSKGAAMLALAAYVAEYTNNQNMLANSSKTPVNPEFDRKKMYEVATNIAKRWSTDPEGDKAWNVLLAIAINEKKSEDILRALENIKETSELRADAEIQAGRALWSLYNEQFILDDATPGKMPASEMQKLATEANKVLEKAMEREKPKINAPTDMQLKHAETQMFLAESRMLLGQAAKALECIDDAKTGLMPLVRAAAQNPAATVDPVKLESVKLALQAYVLNDKLEEAQKLTAELSSLLGEGGEGQKAQLANTYLNLSLRIEKQIDQNRQTGNLDALKNAAKGFTFFLGELVNTADAFEPQSRFQNLNWVSENYYRLGADLVGQPNVAAQDRTTGVGYLETSIGLDTDTLIPMTQEDSEARMVVKLRKARALRKSQKFDEAVDTLTEILTKKQQLIEAQIDACDTLADKAATQNDPQSYLLAINGTRPDANGSNVVWGWRRIADTMRNSPQFQTPVKPTDPPEGASPDEVKKHQEAMQQYQGEMDLHKQFMELFHSSRLKVAENYMSLAEATPAGDERTKHLKAVSYIIDSTADYTPDLGGDQWKPKYEQLKQKAASALGQ